MISSSCGRRRAGVLCPRSLFLECIVLLGAPGAFASRAPCPLLWMTPQFFFGGTTSTPFLVHEFGETDTFSSPFIPPPHLHGRDGHMIRSQSQHSFYQTKVQGQVPKSPSDPHPGTSVELLGKTDFSSAGREASQAAGLTESEGLSV